MAFTSVVDGRGYVWLVSTKGNGLAEVREAGGVNETQPVFSPDGEHIYYVSDENGSRDIWVMDANGANPRLLIETPEDAYDPAIAPDGNQLALIVETDGNPDLWLYRVDSEELLRLTDTPEIESAPTWMSGSLRIVYARADEDGSYTHLTLPTILRVKISLLAGSKTKIAWLVLRCISFIC